MAKFKYNGRIITAATKQQAIRKIIASGLTKQEKDLQESRFNGAVDEFEFYTYKFIDEGRLSAQQLQGLYDAVRVMTAFGERGQRYVNDAIEAIRGSKHRQEGKKVISVLEGNKPSGSSATAASKKDPRETACAKTAKYVLSYVKKNATRDAQLSEPKKVNKSDDDFYVLYDLNVSGKKCKLYAGETDYSITEKKLGTFEGSTDLSGAANSDLDEFVGKVKKLGEKKGSRVKASASFMRRRARAQYEPKDSEGIIKAFKDYFAKLDLCEMFGGGDYIYRTERGLDTYDKDLIDDGDSVSKTYWTTLFMLGGGGYVRSGSARDELDEQRRECAQAFDDENGEGAYERIMAGNDQDEYQRYYDFEEKFFDDRLTEMNETYEVSFKADFDEEEGSVHFELQLPCEGAVIDKDYPLSEEGLSKLKADVNKV